MNTDIKDVEFVVFDVETTGLEPKNGDRICEIGAIKIKGEKELGRFYSLVNPDRQVSLEAYNVNHISNEMVKDAPKSDVVLPKFLEFSNGACLTGYNVGFDINFLDNELCLMGRKLDSSTPVVDILQMSRQLYKNLPSYSLKNFSNFLGLGIMQEHRAMEDVELTLKVFRVLMKKLTLTNMSRFNDVHNLFGRNFGLINDSNSYKIAQIMRAIDLGVSLDLRYFTSSSGIVTTRLVDPQEVFEERGQKYLLAYCHLRKDKRNFRLEGILDMEMHNSDEKNRSKN